MAPLKRGNPSGDPPTAISDTTEQANTTGDVVDIDGEKNSVDDNTNDTDVDVDVDVDTDVVEATPVESSGPIELTEEEQAHGRDALFEKYAVRPDDLSSAEPTTTTATATSPEVTSPVLVPTSIKDTQQDNRDNATEQPDDDLLSSQSVPGTTQTTHPLPVQQVIDPVLPNNNNTTNNKQSSATSLPRHVTT